MDDPKAKLDILTRRRDDARTQVERIRGRLDSARQDLTQVDEECRRRKVDPEGLDDVIKQLEERLDREMASLTEGVAEAEVLIAPYLEEGTE